MITLFCYVTRNPALSAEEFQRRWADEHGPLIAGTPELARHLLRYEQHPRVPGPGGGPTDHDGVAVQTYASMDDFLAFLAEPAYRELVAPDEECLLDLDRIEVVFTDEPRVLIGGADADR